MYSIRRISVITPINAYTNIFVRIHDFFAIYMFTLNAKYQIERRIQKCDCIRHSPIEISTINTHNSRICINLLREASVISLLNSYLELNFDELHAATGNTYTDGDDIMLVNLGLIALFSFYKLTTSSGKPLQEISHVHIAFSMYKLSTSRRESDVFSIGINRSRDRRKRDLTNNKTQNRKFQLRIYLKDIFGFAEHHETATYCLGYKLTLTRNTDNAVLIKDNATPVVKLKLTVFNGKYRITNNKF